MATDKAPAVYAAIAKVLGEIGAEGIQKTRKNTQGGGYQYRGVDDVLNALNPLLHKHALVIVPHLAFCERYEGKSNSGGVLRYVAATVDYIIASADDGSAVTARVCGEAFDSGDKATAKALSMAYKYLCFQLFAIPIVGASHDNEEDDPDPIPGAWGRDTRAEAAKAARTPPAAARESGAGAKSPAAKAGKTNTPTLHDRRKLQDAVRATAARTGMSIAQVTAAVHKNAGKDKDFTLREITAAIVFLAHMEAPAGHNPDELRAKIKSITKDMNVEEADACLERGGLVEMSLDECNDVAILESILAELTKGI